MTSREPIELSVVVPVFNHGRHLGELCARIDAAVASRWSHELILVDDGSNDDTWRIISELASEPHVRGLRLATNSGQTAALCAGMEAAAGAVVATIDADLDTDPDDLGALVEAIEAGADVANGCRRGRDWRRRLPSQLFNRRLARLGLPYTDGGSGMFALRGSLAREALAHGELRRGFRIKLLLASLADRVVEVPVRAGRYLPSHHRVTELISGWFELEVAANRSAMLGVAALGLAIAVAATVGAIAAVVALLAGGGSGTLAVGLACLAALGALLATVGVFANLTLRALHHRSTPFYRVAESVPAGAPADDDGDETG